MFTIKLMDSDSDSNESTPDIDASDFVCAMCRLSCTKSAFDYGQALGLCSKCYTNLRESADEVEELADAEVLLSSNTSVLIGNAQPRSKVFCFYI